MRLQNLQKTALSYQGFNINTPPVENMRIQLDHLLAQVTEISEDCKAEFATGMITEIKRAVVALPTVEELKGRDEVTGRP
ncbi:MAG: hypothetical protein Q8P23_00720, partial [bacterium]|nr:hypothetical protein [bacterium]